MFKLNKSELKKMFLRPAIYVMLVVMSIVLVVSALIYHPTIRQSTDSQFGGNNITVSAMMNAFENDSGLSSKKAINQNLEDAKNIVEGFSNTKSVQFAMKTEIDKIYQNLTDSHEGFLRYELLKYAELKTDDARIKVEACVLNVKEFAENLHTICMEINPDYLDIYISTDELNSVINYSRNIYLNWPTKESMKEITDRKVFSETIDNLVRNYTPVTTYTKSIIDNAQKIDISSDIVNSIISKYYTAIAYKQGSETLLTKAYKDITDYVAEHSSETSEECVIAFNELTTKYRNISDIACNLLLNKFNYAKIGDYSDNQLKNFCGFEKFNSYKIQETITLNQYLLDNSIFDGKYLVNFNFNTTSGYAESAYDFCVYAMQILSVVLAVFAMFFMANSLAGDQQSGVMKMLATRPITRYQIVSGKTLSCINFTLIFALFGLVASLVVGFAMFGFGSEYSIITVFNATSIVCMPPALMLFVYFISLMLNIIFFIILASFFAVIFRSTASSLFVTLIVYIASLILMAFLSGASWFIFTPFAYLDLFKYLGGGSIAGGLLTFGVPQISAWLAILIYAVLILIFSVITKLIFKKRDIT